MKISTGKEKNRLIKVILSFVSIMIIAILLETQITWILSRNSAERSAALLLNQVETVLQDNEDDEKDRTEELKETYISYAQAVAYILDVEPDAVNNIDELKKIAELQQIDEIHIFDESGTIIAGTVPEYYGYSFDSGEQMGYFKPMLEDRSLTMCQDITPNTAEGKSMMYAIVWNQAGTRMIQVGVEPKRLLSELNNNSISNVIGSIPVTEGLNIYVVDARTYEIAASTDSEAAGTAVSSEYGRSIASAEDGSGHGMIRQDGKAYCCEFRMIDDYLVAAAYDMSASADSVLVSVGIIAVYLLIAGFGILFLMNRLYGSEEKLKASIHGLKEDEAIIRAAGHGIWKCPIDTGGHICGMIGNDEWKHIFGAEGRDMSPEEGLRYFTEGLVHKEDDPRQYDYSSVPAGNILRMTFAWNHPTKGVIYVEIGGTCQKNADGELQTTGFAADVTEQTLAKQRWEEELLTAREKAEAASTAKTTFLFNMSHDIRTPMNAIIGFTDLIEKHYDDREKCMDYLHKTQEANKFLLSLINNVLEMARIESGKEQLDETVCRTGVVTREMISIFEDQMRQKNITFTSKIEIRTPYMLCDQPKLREICLNILSNAVKYTPEGGSIHIEMLELPCERPGYARIRGVCADTGIGMSKDFLPHLFEEFTRAQTATESRQQGTGLGMPIVKKLIDLVGGTIEVESEPGKGSTFTVTVDLKIADAAAETRPEIEAETVPTDFAGKRILLAEDNELNAEIAIEILSDAGFAAERAADGVICVDMLQKAAPGYYDLILMDIQMPNLDGYGAAKRIRAMDDPGKANIPIIAMTANAFEEDRRNALAAGMNGHLAKPIEIPKLMETLTEILK